MGWLDKILGKQASSEIATIRASHTIEPTADDPHTMRDTNVYHEAFVPGEADADGRFHWSARVYGPGRVVIENSGVAGSLDGAHSAALAWCATKKFEMRGQP